MIQELLQSVDPRTIGHRIQELRKAKRLTQQDVANLLGVARTTITAVENGRRQLQPREMVRLCDSWGLSVNELLRQREVVDNFVPQLRAVFDAHNSVDMDTVIEEFRLLCENYLELEMLCTSRLLQKEPPVHDIQGIPVDQAAEDVAAAERHRLGLGNGPILQLRELLESDVGLRVFYLGMPSQVAGMFVYQQRLGGCIAVNSNHPEERRRWTLAHEYAHFLVDRFQTHVTYVSPSRRTPAVERFADGFAAHFLMPTVSVRRRFHDIRRSRQGDITPADLCTFAHAYDVSFEALVRRLESLDLLRPGTWERLKNAGFKVREAQKLLGLSPRDRSGSCQSLPLRYQHLAAEAYERGDLSEGEFARFLRVDRVEARQLAHMLCNQRVVLEEGVVDVPLDFSELIVVRA